MNLRYPCDPAQGATYRDFCEVCEHLYLNYRLEPASVEINPDDERLPVEWIDATAYRAFFQDAGEPVQKQDLTIVSIANPTTGRLIRFFTNERVGLGIMRFSDSNGVPLALLKLYPLAGEALLRSHA